MPDDGLHHDPWPKCRYCGTSRPPYALAENGVCMVDENGQTWCDRVLDSKGLVVVDEEELRYIPESVPEPIDSDRAGTIPDAEAKPKVEAAGKKRRRSPRRKPGPARR